MGLQIGGIASTLGAARTASALFPATTNRNQVELLGAQPDRNENLRGLFAREQQPAFVRVGFGEGTVSTPAAAFFAIDRTVESARKVIPTFQEVRERLRENLDNAPFTRQAENQNEFQREPGLRRVTSRIPEASAQARNFVNTLNETAGATQARLSGEEVQQDETRAQLQINGQNFDFTRTNAGSRLNLFA